MSTGHPLLRMRGGRRFTIADRVQASAAISAIEAAETGRRFFEGFQLGRTVILHKAARLAIGIDLAAGLSLVLVKAW